MKTGMATSEVGTEKGREKSELGDRRGKSTVNSELSNRTEK